MNNLVAFDFKASRPSAQFTVLDPSESLSEGIGGGYPIIGYKGKTWTLRHRGESHLFVRADDGSPISYIDVVILRASKVKAKSYYESYDEGAAGKRPVCASIDGVTPDADVQAKQADACAICARNAWHTDANGRKSRDCQDYKRIAVLVLPQQTARMPGIGTPLLEPVFLRVPPASLQDLGIFGDTMSGQGWAFSSFVTRISFDTSVAHPKFVFKAIQPVGDDEAKTILAMREEAVAKRITGEDMLEQKAAQKVQGASMVQQMGPAQSLGITHQAVAKPVTQPVANKPQVIDLTKNGSSFAVKEEPNTNRTPPPNVGNTAADVGSGEEDKELDALIAGLM